MSDKPEVPHPDIPIDPVRNKAFQDMCEKEIKARRVKNEYKVRAEMFFKWLEK